MIVKSIIVVHRYLGVVLGLVMTVWCLSGFVMMYQGFPETSQDERMKGLERLDMSRCCGPMDLPETAASSFRVEMLNGALVIRTGGRGGGKINSLETGEEIGPQDEARVRKVAETFAVGNGIKGKIAEAHPLKIDQWSVGVARRAQPMWQVKFDDPGKTWIYINAKSAEVVQDANLKERWLSWFGAVPHWLYPTILRENSPVWTQIVIWSSAIGCFLVVTGLVIGFIKLRTKSGGWWPYKRPMWMFHHMFGVFAGVLVLTWTFSGLLTMQPWGLFESPGAVSPDDLASDGKMTWADGGLLMQQAAIQVEGNDIVSVRAAPLFGKPYVMAHTREGEEIRLSAAGEAPLSRPELEAGLAKSGALIAAGKLDVLEKEDAYYYGHKQKVDLPVYRLQLNDPDQTRIYFDYTTGDVKRVADATAKRYRWLESGLHSMDFGFLRARPFWDIVVLLLLAAVTASCATGTWLSFTRVGQDAGALARFFKRRSAKQGQTPVE
ncbi:MAG TPA: PepSY domain-containing protein [Hyphomonadaceae bacterium]|jgi:hypothetical protein|nr:PepSY domain-containing protein [Hyphomonadaceae bacterium]